MSPWFRDCAPCASAGDLFVTYTMEQEALSIFYARAGHVRRTNINRSERALRFVFKQAWPRQAPQFLAPALLEFIPSEWSCEAVQRRRSAMTTVDLGR